MSALTERIHLSVKGQLLGTVGLVTALLAVVAVLGIRELSSANGRMDALYRQNTLGKIGRAHV